MVGAMAGACAELQGPLHSLRTMGAARTELSCGLLSLPGRPQNRMALTFTNEEVRVGAGQVTCPHIPARKWVSDSQARVTPLPCHRVPSFLPHPGGEGSGGCE